MSYNGYYSSLPSLRRRFDSYHLLNLIKEIQLTPNISAHDMEHKFKKAKEILAKGFNLKLSMFFKGRTIVFQEAGKEKMKHFISLIESNKLGKTNGEIKLNGKRLVIIVNHRKLT